MRLFVVPGLQRAIGDRVMILADIAPDFYRVPSKPKSRRRQANESRQQLYWRSADPDERGWLGGRI
jgi:hypothetical protein